MTLYDTYFVIALLQSISAFFTYDIHDNRISSKDIGLSRNNATYEVVRSPVRRISL